MKDFLNQIKYNAKIIFTNKYILCIVFFIFIPFPVNFNTRHTVIYLFELYIALVGIVLFADMMKTEEGFKIHEVLYFSKINKMKLLIIRIAIGTIFIVLFSLLTFFIIYLRLPQEYENLSNIKYFISDYMKILNVFLPTTIFFGILATTISNVFDNIVIGYITSFTYWVYWLVNLDIQSVMHPFGYTVNYINWPLSKVYLLIGSIIMLLVNNFFINKSPFMNKLNS